MFWLAYRQGGTRCVFIIRAGSLILARMRAALVADVRRAFRERVRAAAGRGAQDPGADGGPAAIGEGSGTAGRTVPTTLPGILALVKYVSAARDDTGELPLDIDMIYGEHDSGHAGDRLLKTLATALERMVRSGSVLIRSVLS
jgi:hypothetical protein